jgi:hypothetical protein
LLREHLRGVWNVDIYERGCIHFYRNLQHFPDLVVLR